MKPLYIIFPKTSSYVKNYDGQTECMYILIEDDDLLEKYKTICDKVSANIKKNLIASLSPITKFSETKINFIVMKLQIFTIKNFLR